MPLERETLNVVDHHIIYHVCSHNDETEYFKKVNFSFVTSYIDAIFFIIKWRTDILKLF